MNAKVIIAMASPAEAELIQKAMSVDEKPGNRCSVSARAEGSSLVLDIEASDLGALRATLNSSFREVKIANSVL
jgi:tRNA threonylcarbamoyladenosine modification (KEOPS) complex  Pcc1 subunit